MSKDPTKFIFNNDETSLTNTITNLIKGSNNLDFLVAFFYFSGFSQIYKEIGDHPLRILVGMDADVDETNRIKEFYTYYKEDNRAKIEIKNQFFNEVINVINRADSIDTKETLDAFRVFKEKLIQGTLEVRKTSKPNHSKMYLFNSTIPDPITNQNTGKVIVGSSNFSIQGLKAREEINVYLQDHKDYQDAQKIFNELWNSSIDLVSKETKDAFFENVIKKTWLDNIPKPFIMYIRVLIEYFKVSEERVLTPREITKDSLTEFFDISYQTDAIRDGVSKVRKHSGCIIADVVGLGKSIIASAIAANLERAGDVNRTIIICPPHLKPEWETYTQSFYLKGSCIYTSGKIDQALANYKTAKNLLVIIDEAHRYRNEDTQDYANLHELCAGNKVLLLSATPFNNKPEDIFSLIKLFQIPKHSTIQTVSNLSNLMAKLISQYNELKKQRPQLQHQKQQNSDYIDLEFEEKTKQIARDIRDILDPVIIRRTRIDLLKHNGYSNDLKKHEIKFAKVKPPISQIYQLGVLSDLYIETLDILDPRQNNGKVRGFTGARYKPLTYLHDEEIIFNKYAKMFDMSNFKIGQMNVAQFMRQLLVCRFESSKYAFIQSLTNILKSMENLRKWYCEYKLVPLNDKGGLYNKNYLEDLDDDLDGSLLDIEDYLTKNLSEEIKKGLKFIDANDLTADFLVDLDNDIELFKIYLEKWKAVNTDPKLDYIAKKIRDSLKLEPKRKIIVFTEFSDTSEYLHKEFKKLGIKVISYSGKNARSTCRDTIRANFDAGLNSKNQKNDYDVLVGTDAISEGISLHRAGTIYNYDIPYNPTKVIQRVGRINRINKKVFDELFIYNFFPTATGEDISHRSEISTFKMKLFQAILGSDTQVLTEEETLDGYFNNQYNEAMKNEDTLSWDIEYRNELDLITKNHPELIKEALELPQRSRVARKNVNLSLTNVEGSEYLNILDDNSVLLFTRKGDSFRFSSDNTNANIIPPQQALAIFKCKKDEKGYKVSDDFYTKYENAKKTSGLIKSSATKNKSLQEVNKKLNMMKKLDLPQIDKDYIDSVMEAVNYESISKFNLKRMNKIDPSKLDSIIDLKNIITESFVESVMTKYQKLKNEPEIILLAEEIL